MSTQKQKFALFQRLQNLGFTYEEACQLRRIEMTLHRWSEAECNGDIYRCDDSGEPCRSVEGRGGNRTSYPIADREAGALKRLAAIVDARNIRHKSADTRRASSAGHIFAYHQTDPRGCALYLVKRADLREIGDTGPLSLRDALSQYYTRGLAVCA